MKYMSVNGCVRYLNVYNDVINMSINSEIDSANPSNCHIRYNGPSRDSEPEVSQFDVVTLSESVESTSSSLLSFV